MGSDRFQWCDLAAVLQGAPRDSPLVRVIEPEDSPWGLTETLLHSMEWTLRQLMWAKSEDAQRGRGFPKPIPAPWVKPDSGSQRFGKPVPLADIDKALGWA